MNGGGRGRMRNIGAVSQGTLAGNGGLGYRIGGEGGRREGVCE